jgi:hypothetical protein
LSGGRIRSNTRFDLLGAFRERFNHHLWDACDFELIATGFPQRKSQVTQFLGQGSSKR